MAGHVNNSAFVRCLRCNTENACFAVNIVKVLGEGGFSFVYLAQDEDSGVRSMAAGCSHGMSLKNAIATICPEEDTLSDWIGGRQGGDEGG